MRSILLPPITFPLILPVNVASSAETSAVSPEQTSNMALAKISSIGEPEVKLSADESMVELTVLPVELLRPIFERAANENIETAFSLVHVSLAVNKWTAPSLYRTARLRTEHSARLFRRTIDSQDPSWLATHVHFLVFDYPMRDVEDTRRILAVCSDIIGISFEGTSYRQASFSRLSDLTESCTRLTHLAIRLTELTARDAKFPRTLTHLCVDVVREVFADEALFRTLHDDCPGLTHIGICIHSFCIHVDSRQVFEALAWISRYAHRSPLRLQLIVVNVVLPNLVPQAVRNTFTWHRSWYMYCSPNWPRLAAVYSDGTTMYNPLDMDLEDDSYAIVYHHDTSISWLRDEVWQAGEAVMRWQRDLMDMDTVCC